MKLIWAIAVRGASRIDKSNVRTIGRPRKGKRFSGFSADWQGDKTYVISGLVYREEGIERL
jgi:hypothetical protein